MSDAAGFVSVVDACRHLSISSSYFYLLVKRGEIRPLKLGRRTLVPMAEIKRIVLERSEKMGGPISTEPASSKSAEQLQTNV